MISIIVPIFNTELYLERCILSVINQNYKKFELILIDDCSTDRSYDIASKFAKLDSRVQVFRQDHNMGVSAARNKGLALGKGELVLFLDSDDYIEENSLARLVELQKQSNADIICTQPNSRISYKNVTFNRYKILNGLTALKMFLNLRKISGFAWGKVYKRQVLKNIRFPENMKYGEDGVFSYKALLSSQRIVYSNASFYHYEVRENTLTGRMSDYSIKNLDAFSQINYIKSNIPDSLKNYIQVFEFSLYLNEMKIYERSSRNVKNRYRIQYETMKKFCDSNWLKVLITSSNFRIKLSVLNYLMRKAKNE